MAPRGRGGAQIWRARAKAIATRVPAGLAQSKNIEARHGSDLLSIDAGALPVGEDDRLVGMITDLR
jgi:hypothetical protein